MKDLNIIEMIEKNTFECMDWMENKIKDVIRSLAEFNEKSLRESGNNLYCEGYYDALIDIANELEIELD